MRRVAIGLTALTLALIAGCGPALNSLSTDEQILRRVLENLSAGGHSICVDNAADGGRLQLWRDSMVIARTAGRSLGWQYPTALRPPADMPIPASGHQRQVEAIKPLVQSARLPRGLLIALDAAADHLAFEPTAASSVTLQSGWMPKNAIARWWPFNKLSGCGPYRLNAPQRVGDLAFVQVMSNHWGTVYALRLINRKWLVVAQAAPWLY